jgi:hypothetical protein
VENYPGHSCLAILFRGIAALMHSKKYQNIVLQILDKNPGRTNSYYKIYCLIIFLIVTIISTGSIEIGT